MYELWVWFEGRWARLTFRRRFLLLGYNILRFQQERLPFSYTFLLMDNSPAMYILLCTCDELDKALGEVTSEQLDTSSL